MHKFSFMQMVLGYIPRSEGYIPLFFKGTIVLGTVVGTAVTNDYYLGTHRGAVYGLAHTPMRFNSIGYGPKLQSRTCFCLVKTSVAVGSAVHLLADTCVHIRCRLVLCSTQFRYGRKSNAQF